MSSATQSRVSRPPTPKTFVMPDLGLGFADQIVGFAEGYGIALPPEVIESGKRVERAQSVLESIEDQKPPELDIDTADGILGTVEWAAKHDAAIRIANERVSAAKADAGRAIDAALPDMLPAFIHAFDTRAAEFTNLAQELEPYRSVARVWAVEGSGPKHFDLPRILDSEGASGNYRNATAVSRELTELKSLRDAIAQHIEYGGNATSDILVAQLTSPDALAVTAQLKYKRFGIEEWAELAMTPDVEIRWVTRDEYEANMAELREQMPKPAGVIRPRTAQELNDHLSGKHPLMPEYESESRF